MKKGPKSTELFKIFWIVGGVVKEEIRKDTPVPRVIANYLKKQLEETTHTMGKLKVVPADEKPSQLKLF